jgi:saccharopine dehydrogenase (NAD+, L-lysine-forming)
MTLFWLREEARATERRAAIGPLQAEALVRAGAEVMVEGSGKRVFGDHAYAAAGCGLAAGGSWTEAPKDAVILGLKELPPAPATLRHRFIHFAHLYKEQAGWDAEIARFEAGGGQLYDLEYLTDGEGRRIAAFGFWAGWIGAALAAWRFRARRLGIAGPEAGIQGFASRSEVEMILRDLAERDRGEAPRALVVGARGRSGQCAIKALRAAGIAATDWEKPETENLDRAALLGHEILVNCVLVTGPGLLLANAGHLRSPGARLELIADVSCDPLSAFNPLPLYRAPTSWEAPFITVGENAAGRIVELMAIDNLPSLLPKEASEDFAAQLLPALLDFPTGEVWERSLQAFEAARDLRRHTATATAPALGRAG